MRYRPGLALPGALVLLAALILARPASAELLQLGPPEDLEQHLASVNFVLERDAELKIDWQLAVSPAHEEERGWSRWGHQGDPDLVARAWIINAETRRVVWEPDTDSPQRNRDLLLIDSETQKLPAGEYLLYFWWAGVGDEDDSHWSWSWGKDDEKDHRRLSRELADLRDQVLVKVDASGLKRGSRGADLPGSLLSIVGVGDSVFERRGFELTATTKLRAYGLMEKPSGSRNAADFGWIADYQTGERIWDMNQFLGRRAGGGKKNRVLDRTVELPAGRYVLGYGSDDSHSANAFNTSPPNDPLAWGIQLVATDDQSRRAFRQIDLPSEERRKPDLDFSRARSGDFHEGAIHLARDGQVDILAMGEAVDDGWTFVDYGWIVNAADGRTVWEMEERNTQPAGGGEKNRIFEGRVSLKAGNYLVFYQADDSHAWRDWNSGEPFRPEAWGLQLWAVDGTRLEIRDSADLPQPEGMLATHTRVGDRAHERSAFEMKKEGRIEVYALGEGSGGKMHDFAWIEDDRSGDIVWEMDFDRTDHAGGARKNREQRASLKLPAGSYVLHYRSDGSHSFEGWNDSRPNQPLAWGASVRMLP